MDIKNLLTILKSGKTLEFFGCVGTLFRIFRQYNWLTLCTEEGYNETKADYSIGSDFGGIHGSSCICEVQCDDDDRADLWVFSNGVLGGF
jgi:hypothetical protein